MKPADVPASAVPSSRLARLSRLGGLASGVAGGMLAEGLRQVARGNRPRLGDLLLTPGNDGTAGKFGRREIGLSLFDMQNDPFETTNVIDKYPDMAARMQTIAERHRREFFQ